MTFTGFHFSLHSFQVIFLVSVQPGSVVRRPLFLFLWVECAALSCCSGGRWWRLVSHFPHPSGNSRNQLVNSYTTHHPILSRAAPLTVREQKAKVKKNRWYQYSVRFQKKRFGKHLHRLGWPQNT
jgi:hypothetical protein